VVWNVERECHGWWLRLAPNDSALVWYGDRIVGIKVKGFWNDVGVEDVAGRWLETL